MNCASIGEQVTTRRISSPRAGVFVGLLLAGYGMAVVFDLLILGECLLLFLGCLALWLVVRRGANQTLWVGALIGLMGLARPTFLLLLLPFGAYVLTQASRHRLQSLAVMASVPIALSLLVSVPQWRDGPGSLIAYSGGYNFFVGNGPLANGTYVDFTGAYDLPISGESDDVGGINGDGRDYLRHVKGLHLSPSGSSAYWYKATLDQVSDHPVHAAQLLLRKVALLFNRRELPQIIDADAYNRAAGPLGWPLGWEFVILGVGGLLGSVTAWRLGPVGRVLCGWLLTLVIGFAVFFVVDRYRIHLVPPLALLTGIGAEQFFALWTARRWVNVWTLAGVAVVGMGLTLAPLVPADHAQRAWSYATTMGDAWLAKREPRRALTSYEQAIAIDRSGGMRGANTQAGRLARAGMYEAAGTTCALVGDDQRALDYLATAVQLAPAVASARARYAEQLAECGRFDEAREQFTAAGVPLQDAANQLVGRAARGQWPADRIAMRRLLSAAAGISPGSEHATVPLVRLEIMSRSFDAAVAILRTAEANGLDANVARAHTAWIQAALGDTLDAQRILEAIPMKVRTGDQRVATTLELLRQDTGWEPRSGR